jgi:hypothetical protein
MLPFCMNYIGSIGSLGNTHLLEVATEQSVIEVSSHAIRIFVEQFFGMDADL